MMAVDYDAHDDATNNNNDEPTNTASMTTSMEDIAILQHELWLFWWGQEEPALSIDVEQTESRLGSFSWDAISSSTGAASRLPIHLAVTLPEECDLFLEALRNLCTRGLAHQHIISLGNLFIFDGLNHHRSSTISDNRLDGFRLHIQITASNVLLLPERCQLPIRRLTADDLHYTEAESHLYLPVKLSPFGINGQLLKHHEVYRPICDALAEQQLDRWSTLHAIPLDVLRAPMTSNLPLFVMIRIGNMLLSYPTALVFPLIDTNDSALSSSNDTPHLSSVLRVSVRDPVKMNAWSYVDHCNNLASAVLAQCAAHEPTSLGESPNNSEWKPVIIDSASNIDATKQSNVANKSANEDEIMTQLCDIFQTAPPSNNESVTAVASSNLGGSITTPNDTGVGTPAPTLNTLGSGISSNVNDESRRTSGLSALDGLNDFYNFVDDPDTEMVTEDDFNFFDDYLY
ncbi:hypothetical protein BDF22DRAFT_291171 [Syncephalis plumigaleata]|nr:hypothetical protein BDF22DRAFT_291171 [Syncephalis plumigaleata]